MIGIKTFNRSCRHHRQLSEAATQWLNDNRHLRLIDIEVRQSSDLRYHNISIVFTYDDSDANCPT